MGDPSIAEITAKLNWRIADLAKELLGEPNGALSTKHQLRYGSKGSIAVETDGLKAGQWYDHERGTGGDGLALIRHQRRLPNGPALDWARDWLGLPAWSGHLTAQADVAAFGGVTPEKVYLDPAEDASAAAAPDAGDKALKFAAIVRRCSAPAGTSADLYLEHRGITTRPLPDCLRYRPNAFGGYGALVALATEADGTVAALQQIYITNQGRKAPVKVSKRTNKARDGWTSVAAVRLPGKPALVLCEGVETALSVWQATGRETWACLGIPNIGKAPVPEGEPVIIARDGDVPGSKADNQIIRSAQALVERGHSVSVATPPEGKDANDVLVAHGDAAVRALIDGAKKVGIECDRKELFVGSDVEIAGRVREDLIERFGRIVSAEGAFWRFGGTHWEPIEDHELRIAVHAYDGAAYKTPTGEPSRVKLGKGRVDSALSECAALCAAPRFFETPQIGINCASGFIRFSDEGKPALEPHHRDHRRRHVLPARWSCSSSSAPPAGSLLARLLGGSFRGDDDEAAKVALLGEIAGSAALGHATKLRQPRAVILKGETAENGKSQILDLARGLLPVSAISSVTAARMGDERHIVGLVGKLLNASDELSSAVAIASDTFKAVVTGEPVQGRDVYKSRVEFRPVAQHLFATNTLPAFAGGMDRGVQRRLLVVQFNRVIPTQERIEGIGRRIGEEEADLLLAWAVDGAARLIRRRDFTMPRSSQSALNDWLYGADPVLAWLEARVDVVPIRGRNPKSRTSYVYSQFQAWALAEGFKKETLPAINGFVQRIKANAAGIEYHRASEGRFFLGMVIRHFDPSSPPA